MYAHRVRGYVVSRRKCECNTAIRFRVDSVHNSQARRTNCRASYDMVWCASVWPKIPISNRTATDDAAVALRSAKDGHNFRLFDFYSINFCTIILAVLQYYTTPSTSSDSVWTFHFRYMCIYIRIHLIACTRIVDIGQCPYLI